MLGLLSNGKSVIIAEERRFCRSPKFSLDFPKKLSGIINPDEFQQSVTNINRACKTTIWEKTLLLSLFLCSLIGLLIFIAGVSVIFLSIAALWIPLMTIGFALFLTFLTIAIFVSSRVYRLCDTRLDRAVEAESKKYSKRSPIPTKWRLDMTIYTRRFSIAATPTDIQYFLLIEIGEKSGLKIKSKPLTMKLNISKSTSDIAQPSLTNPSSLPKSSTVTSSDKTLYVKDQASIHLLV